MTIRGYKIERRDGWEKKRIREEEKKMMLRGEENERRGSWKKWREKRVKIVREKMN